MTALKIFSRKFVQGWRPIVAHVVVGMATVYLALACIPTTLGWTQVGGKVNPMGEREKVLYVRLGQYD